MKEDVGGHKAAVQEDKSIDEEDVGVDAAANEEDVGGKPAGDKAVVQEDAGDDAGDKAAGNRAAGDRGAVEENAIEKAAVEEEAVEKAAVEKAAVEEAAVDDVEKAAVQEDEAVEKQDVEEHEAVVEALLAVGSTAIEGDVMVKTSISKMWVDEMKLLDTQRDITRFEKEEQERSQPIESNSPPSPPSPQGKKDRKKRVKKTSDPSPKAVNVWEDYPEFVPLNYQPSSDILRHVTGYQLLYPQPWWQLDSVLVPCHVHGHWMLCHVLLKEGKVMHAGYYQQIKMDPRSTPFTAESMHSDLIPQQDDGNSCGAFLLKLTILVVSNNGPSHHHCYLMYLSNNCSHAWESFI
ncbi:hypothetical protein Q3G72_029571 [Acer saccharum]|nr:hypothetical protein Q3G72_029571 [Acer saccharum]